MNRASTRLIAKPRIISHDTWAPYSAWATATIASLVGTTPWAPVAPRIMAPSGSSEAMTSVAPAPISRNPRVAFSAEPMTCPALLRSATMPTAVMMPMRKAGTLRISLTRNCAMVTNQSMTLLRVAAGR